MVELNQLYKCGICGNIVEVTHASGGQLVCCGQPMDLLKANFVEASIEKHKPVIKKTADGKTIIKVGLVPHPMEEKHYIEFIEALVGDKVLRKYLHPSEKPEMIICDCGDDCKCGSDCSCGGEIKKARAYCNLHGLWKNN